MEGDIVMQGVLPRASPSTPLAKGSRRGNGRMDVSLHIPTSSLVRFDHRLAGWILPVLVSLSPCSSSILMKCDVGEVESVTAQYSRCKVVSDLLRRFPDLLESQSSRPNHLSPSPPINHVTHLTGTHPRSPPAYRSDLNPQPPESSLRTRPRPPHSRSQTMVLPTSPSTTLETRSYFSIEV